MSEWQRRTLHVLVIIFIGFTTAIETAILAANGKKSNETIAVQVGNDGKAVPLFQQREQTCHDRSRYCPEWAELAECRKKNARVYMTDNCPLSCNLCNPLLEPWYPGESHGRGINRMTFESKVEKDFQIFTGVPQKGEFSRQSSPLRSEDNREYVKSRVHDVILSQSNYLDDYYRDIQYVKHRTLISASSIDVDDTDIPPGTKLPLAETCINRHSYCALWAIQGFCDMQPRRMKAVCAPMCHCK
jgi:ShK domain-like.